VLTMCSDDPRGLCCCRMRDYLAAILPGLADLPIKRLAELTPAAWTASRSQLFETRQS
jgi:hypothetical protein